MKTPNPTTRRDFLATAATILPVAAVLSPALAAATPVNPFRPTVERARRLAAEYHEADRAYRKALDAMDDIERPETYDEDERRADEALGRLHKAEVTLAGLILTWVGRIGREGAVTTYRMPDDDSPVVAEIGKDRFVIFPDSGATISYRLLSVGQNSFVSDRNGR